MLPLPLLDSAMVRAWVPSLTVGLDLVSLLMLGRAWGRERLFGLGALGVLLRLAFLVRLSNLTDTTHDEHGGRERERCLRAGWR